MNLLEYIGRRLLALIPTLIGISFISFLLINSAPGGPVEQALQRMRFGGGEGSASSAVSSRNDSAVTDEVIQSLKRQYGFNKPLITRYGIWLGKLVRFDFGESFNYHRKVTELIVEKFPVSLLFGLTSFLLTYLICIPLGIYKALYHGTKFDLFTSASIFIAYSIPGFLLAILLIVYVGPNGFDLFPIQGLKSELADTMPFFERVWDRIHHAILPLTCYCIGGFASLTVLMKNSLLEEIKKDYVRTARAKGLDENTVVFKHVLRNALMPIATGIGSFLGVFFAGSLLLETVFNLDGIGLLSYNSVMQRDYNVIMGLLTIQTFIFLLGNLFSDLLYVFLDPRVDFSSAG